MPLEHREHVSLGDALPLRVVMDEHDRQGARVF
jgi:hypothetical protein